MCYNPQMALLSLDTESFHANATINIESRDLNMTLNYAGIPINVNLTPGTVYHISAILDNGQIYRGEFVYL